MRLLLILSIVSIIFSQNYSLAERIELALFNYQNEEALVILNENKERISKYRYATFRAVIYFNRYFRDQPAKRNKAYADSMLAAVQPTLDDEDKILAEKVPDDMLMLGGALGFKGMAEFIHKNRVSALGYADDAKDILDELVELHPEIVDAYFGIGVYNFALGQPPAYLRFLLAILGYSGDKELGYRQVKRVAQAGKDTKVQSLLFLINHSLYSSFEYSKTYPLLDFVPEHLLKTPMYYYKRIQLEYHMGYYDKALASWQAAKKLNFGKATYVANNLNLYAAKAYIGKGEFSKADSLINIVNRAKDFPLRGFAYEVSETIGDKFFALKNYNEAHKLYLRIYERTTVDRRKDRLEKKLERIEGLTNGKLTY